MTAKDDSMELVELMARAAYTANCWWRKVGEDDDRRGRYRNTGSIIFRAVEWENLDDDQRDQKRKEMNAALTAIEASGRRIVPVEPKS